LGKEKHNNGPIMTGILATGNARFELDLGKLPNGAEIVNITGSINYTDVELVKGYKMKIVTVGVQGIKYYVYISLEDTIVEAYKDGKNITNIKTLRAIQAVIDSKKKA
jgi:hypothetical protein